MTHPCAKALGSADGEICPQTGTPCHVIQQTRLRVREARGLAAFIVVLAVAAQFFTTWFVVLR